MKKTIYVHARANEWSENGFELCYFDADMTNYTCPLLATVEVDFELPPTADLVNGFVSELRNQQSIIRADCEVKVQEIEYQIGKLLAIEDRSQS